MSNMLGACRVVKIDPATGTRLDDDRKEDA